MKPSIIRILSAAAAIFIALPAFSQYNGLLEKIEAANSTVSSIEASFSQTRYVKAVNRSVKTDGAFHFKSPDRMAMVYSRTEGNKFIINGNTIYTKTVETPKAKVLDMAHNEFAARLGKTLLNCIRGKVNDAAKDNDAKVAIQEKGGNYVITLIANTASTRGYSGIILTYRKKDLLLVSMVLNEVSGVSTTYSLEGISTTAKADPSVFEIR